MKFVIALSILFLSLVTSAGLPTSVSATGNYHETSPAICEGDITIPVSTVVWGDKGSEHKLGSANAENGEYKLTVKAINQDSVHPDSDIIVRSNGSELIVKDVERKAFGQDTADGTLTVSDGKVTAYVKLGKDKVFSGGVCVILTQIPQEDPKCTIPGKEEFSPEDEECRENPEEPTPEVEEPQVLPEVLPAAGPGAMVVAIATLSTVGGYAGHYLATRRKG